MKKIHSNLTKTFCAFALILSSINVIANDYVITASNDDGNLPTNTVDGKLETRWSAKGQGEWIQYDLGDSQLIDALKVAFYRGDQRSANISIDVSDGANDWLTVFSGEQPSDTTQLQTYDIDDTEAQFVRIIGYGNSENAWNSLTEVEIKTLDIEAGLNLALGKKTTQSSTKHGGISNRAVDGNTSGAWNKKSITHTNNELQPWWEVDLDSVKNVGSVNIWNRTVCCSTRLSDFYILTSETPFKSTDLDTTLQQDGVSNYYHSETAGTPSSISIDKNARYIRVQLATKSPLSIAEFEVIAGDEY